VPFGYLKQQKLTGLLFAAPADGKDIDYVLNCTFW